MYSSMLEQEAGNVIADFRSDTVTRATAGMRQAMAEARVGDDVYGEDASVLELQRRMAELTGKEAALFFPTGTMSNLAALLAHCGRGDEYIAADCSHIFRDEAAGASVLGGIAACGLATDAVGAFTAEQLRAAIKPDDPHCPQSRLLCLENTIGGRVQDQFQMQELSDLARSQGLAVHLDGARLVHAAVASGQSIAELSTVADTVSICLSKGLGCPIGSVLTGTADVMARALRARKILGGGLRQAGHMAACGLYALDHHVARLAEDHRLADILAAGLAEMEEIALEDRQGQTNMVFFDPGLGHHQPLAAYLAKRGIRIGAQQPWIRLVTHLDLGQDEVDQLLNGIRDYFKQA